MKFGQQRFEKNTKTHGVGAPADEPRDKSGGRNNIAIKKALIFVILDH